MIQLLQGHPEYLYGLVEAAGLVIERDVATWIANQGGWVWTEYSIKYREGYGYLDSQPGGLVCTEYGVEYRERSGHINSQPGGLGMDRVYRTEKLL